MGNPGITEPAAGTIEMNFDEEIDRLYNDVLGSFWEPEERFVNSCYRSLSFPTVYFM